VARHFDSLKFPYTWDSVTATCTLRKHLCTVCILSVIGASVLLAMLQLYSFPIQRVALSARTFRVEVAICPRVNLMRGVERLFAYFGDVVVER